MLIGDLCTRIARSNSNSPVGLGVGPVGDKDGSADGPYVGLNEMVGTRVGLLDGDSDGDVVEERIGLLVGEPGMIGEEVGIVEGGIVG